MSGLRFSRKSVALLIFIVAILISLLGVMWVWVSINLDHKNLSEIIGIIFSILTTVITSFALFAILTLWSDPKQDSRIKINQFMLDYIELRDSKAPSYALVHIVGSIRAQASLAQYTSEEIRGYLKSLEEGQRIAGLSIVQQQWYKDRPNPSIFSRGRQSTSRLLTNVKRFLEFTSYVSRVNTKREKNDKYFDKLVNEYFDDVVAMLSEPKTAFEHYQAILVTAFERFQDIRAMAGAPTEEQKKEAEKAKGIMFHLNAIQQLKLCLVVDNYKYEGDDAHTSKEWVPFKNLVHKEYCNDVVAMLNDIVAMLGEPKTATEHSQTIEAIAGIGTMKSLKKGKKVDEAKGIMFQLNAKQQQELCKVVDNYKYEGDDAHTSKEWVPFKNLVHEQTWCKGGS